MNSSQYNSLISDILTGIPQKLPPAKGRDADLSHAPDRKDILSKAEKKLALKNALRYLPVDQHREILPELLEELDAYGRIYMYRLKPDYELKARNIEDFPHQSKQAAAIMLMVMNNLDKAVAQHPDELITYGGNGAVFRNWAQYRLCIKYLAEMTDEQTLVLYSGHPMGLFPSHRDAPRVVITNGMVIPNYSSQDHWEKFNALGVSQYGQMTAGSFMYIGPQGIVHGTTITVLNAGRMKSQNPDEGLGGKVFVTSGLGGMSGAQAKATVIAGGICIVAEINPMATAKRHEQGWVDEVYYDFVSLFERLDHARMNKEAVSLAYQGNIVDLWEELVRRNIRIELGSDQTSLHNPWSGGYYPAGVSFEKANNMMKENPDEFKRLVRESLKRQVLAINEMVNRGMYFWDYGNAFLLEAGRSGADVLNQDGTYKYPSYVQDIMGPLFFDYGFGPFRWVCTSNDPADLETTDKIAAEVIEDLMGHAPDDIKMQMADNLHWIREAGPNKMVVGSQARILYADAEGRMRLAKAFNDAIRNGEIKGPVVLGRDHHDVSGTDSPFRETSNIYDGSSFTADMAIQNVIGDSFRGATWVSIHNGGGVGWGEVINGGFGLVLDGSAEAGKRAQNMLHWDVNNGIARRSWARNKPAMDTIKRAMKENPDLVVTLPEVADDELLESFVR